MKLLLTSAGVKNASIADALARMLGKPIAEASALVWMEVSEEQTSLSPWQPGVLA